MNTDEFLLRLEHVRSTGDRRWVACCPAHQDARPSLAIRELDDGRTLLHCFAGCDVNSVVSSVGLDLSDLFPGKFVAHAKPERRPWRAADLIALVDRESLIVFVEAADLIEGKTLDEAAMQRLQQARARISAISEAIC